LAKHRGERSYAAADAANEPRLALDNHTDVQIGNADNVDGLAMRVLTYAVKLTRR